MYLLLYLCISVINLFVDLNVHVHVFFLLVLYLIHALFAVALNWNTCTVHFISCIFLEHYIEYRTVYIIHVHWKSTFTCICVCTCAFQLSNLFFC